jgi:hypothetical protein
MRNNRRALTRFRRCNSQSSVGALQYHNARRGGSGTRDVLCRSCDSESRGTHAVLSRGDRLCAYLYGSATGIWNVGWITFWGVMLFNTLVAAGAFDKLRRWLIRQGTRDVRLQTIPFAWSSASAIHGPSLRRS